MRNLERIPLFLYKLNALWHRVPDWRFGQLMSNVFAQLKESSINSFYIEDNQMIEKIEEVIKKWEGLDV